MNTSPDGGEKAFRGIPEELSNGFANVAGRIEIRAIGRDDAYPDDPDPDDPYLDDPFQDEPDDDPFGDPFDDPDDAAVLDDRRRRDRLMRRAAGFGRGDARQAAFADVLPWWQPFLVGALAVAFGAVLLGWHDIELSACWSLVGAWLLAVGVTRIAGAVRTKEGRGAGEIVFSALLGVLFVVAGVVAVRGVFTTVMLLVVVLALAWLLSGFADLMIGLSRHHPGRGWMSLSGLLATAVGVGFLLLPDVLLSALVPVAGKSALAYGILQMVLAFGVRRASRAFVQRETARTHSRGYLAES